MNFQEENKKYTRKVQGNIRDHSLSPEKDKKRTRKYKDSYKKKIKRKVIENHKNWGLRRNVDILGVIHMRKGSR